MTPDEIGATYGWDKAEELEGLVDSGMVGSVENFEYFEQTFGGERRPQQDEADSRELRRIRVIERQHYRVDDQYFFADLTTGALRPVPYGSKKEEAEAFAEKYGLEVITQRSPSSHDCNGRRRSA